jgi:hypothetical protein
MVEEAPVAQEGHEAEKEGPEIKRGETGDGGATGHSAITDGSIRAWTLGH